MDTTHLRHHLQDLSGRRYFLRTLKPDTDRYKLWLGDLVELVNAAYGSDSREMADLRAVLAEHPRLPAGATEEDRTRRYVERLEALGGLLDRFERGTGEARSAEINGA